MKKICFITLLWIFPTLVFSAIDERKVDIYFANGIKTSEDEAWKNTYEILRPAINKDLFKNNEIRMKKYIGKFDYAYNNTHGMFIDRDGGFDLLESFLQKLSLQNPLDDLISILTLRMVETAHGTDLRDQVQKYKDSIEAGHKVLVVAHSQGNLFTYEAYRKLDGWMQEYFYAISIASPGNDFIKEGTPRISWDNDLVAHLGLYDGLLNNPVRKVGWKKLTDQIPLSDKLDKPYSDYLYKQQVRGVFNGIYESSEETTLLGLIPIGLIDSNVHAFSFYMGADLKNSDDVVQVNGLNVKEMLSTGIARDKIIDEVRKGLLKLELLPSQWKVKQTQGCGCDKNVTLTHIEPTANLDHLVANVNPLLFSENGKLYQLYQLYDETNSTLSSVF